MFNLLPIEDKNLARAEYRHRIVTVSLLSLFLVLISVFIFLIPSYVEVSNAKYKVEKSLTSMKKLPTGENYKDLEDVLKKTKKEIDFLKINSAARSDIAEVIQHVLRFKPKGISVDSIAWVLASNEQQVVVNGIASNRDLLRKFVSILEADKDFSEVSLPVSSYTKFADANFSITLVLK
jgi:hypothetical protein